MSCEDIGSDYSPNSLVRAFHDIPHVDIDLDSSPDQFETTSEYLEAIIIWACVPILVCVCLFILLSVYFICVCCGFCCGERASRNKTRRNVCGILITLLITLCLAMVGVGIWAEVALNDDINDFVDIAEDIDTTLQQFGDDSTGYSETRVENAIDSLQDEVMMDQNVTDALDRLEVENTAIGTAFMEIEPFIPVNSTLSDTISDLEDFEAIRHWAIIAYLIFLAVFLLVLTCAICCGACCWSSTLIVVMLIVLFFTTFSVWVATGGSLAFMIVASDICDNPDELVRNYTQDFNANQEFVNYYLVCNSTCFPHPFLTEIDQVQMALSMAQDDLEIVQDYINDGNTDLQPTFDIVLDGFDGAEDAVELLLDCATGLNRDYLDILERICGREDGVLHAFLIFVMACGLAVSFILLLMCGACYAGILVSRKEFDEEGIQYDFPPTTGPSAWESYGTQQHYTGGNYLQYRDAYNHNLASSPTGQDPPKYNELHHLNNGQQAQRHSGGYDHIET